MPLPRPGLYPFWFWNGIQTEPEISRQMALFQASGCRGVVLHSRTGNQIPYLSDRWFELIRHACLEAKRLGLKAWLYDEDGYPSGNAGMCIQKDRPDLIQKSLLYAYEGTDPAAPAFAAYDPETYRLLDENAVPAGTPALRFRIAEHPRHVDTLHPETCRLFLEWTHERYLAAVGDLFGDVLEAVYTDDESYLVWAGSGLVYSPALETEYRDRLHRDLRDDLPLLVEELPGFEAARLRYHTAAEGLFLRHFIQPQQDWCTAHGLAYIGHLCGDEGELHTSIKNFGLAQPYLLLQDVPSIDSYLCDLRDHAYLRETHNNSATSYENCTIRRFPCLLPYVHAGSIARLFKPHGLFSSETLTFPGWEAPASFQDTQMLFELAMGVNLMTPHAFYYTLGGNTRNDCPPSYFYQQPYFPMLRDLQDKWTHIAELLQQGTAAGSTLVLSPASVLAVRRGCDFRVSGFPNDPAGHFRARHERPDDVLAAYEVVLARTFRDLLRRHVAFEMLEESLLDGRVSLGETSGELRIGLRRYRTVCLPDGEVCPLQPETQALLERFQSAGGRVITPTQIGDLAPDCELPDGFDEVLASVRLLPDGGRLEFLVNLSGRDLPFPLHRKTPFRLYDPASRTVVFEGTDLPGGTLLRKGSACILLDGNQMPSIAFDRIRPLSASLFSSEPIWHPLGTDSIRPLGPNTLKLSLPSNESVPIDLAAGATVSAVYAEGLSLDTLRPQAATSLQGGKPTSATPPVPLEGAGHHPIDPAYVGARLLLPWSGPCHKDLCVSKDYTQFYLEGDFAVDGVRLLAPQALHLGDLAAQGMPYYWGVVEYRFHFHGGARLLRLGIVGGMAEVFVNGVRCGVVSSDPYLLPIADAVREGDNELVIRLANTAQNFVSDNSPVPFGLSRVEIA